MRATEWIWRKLTKTTIYAAEPAELLEYARLGKDPVVYLSIIRPAPRSTAVAFIRRVARKGALKLVRLIRRWADSDRDWAAKSYARATVEVNGRTVICDQRVDLITEGKKGPSLRENERKRATQALKELEKYFKKNEIMTTSRAA